MFRIKPLGYVITIIILISLSLLASYLYLLNTKKKFSEDIAFIIGKSISSYCVETKLEDGDTIQNYINNLKKIAYIEDIKVLKGVSFLAHFNNELKDKRLNPSSLEDKALFDKSKYLESTHQKNIQEKESEPSLKGNAYLEAIFKWENKNNTQFINLAIPIILNDKVEGIVDLTLKPINIKGTLPIIPLIIIGIFSLGIYLIVYNFFKFYHVIPIIIGCLTIVVFSSILGKNFIETKINSIENKAEIISSILESRYIEEGRSFIDILNTFNYNLEDRKNETLVYDIVDISKLDESTILKPKSLWKQFYEKEPHIFLIKDEYKFQISRDYGNKIASSVTSLIYKKGIPIAIIIYILVTLSISLGYVSKLINTIKTHRLAYAYIISAMLGMVFLVFIPFTFGIVLGFFKKIYNVYHFVGLKNFIDILSDFNFVPTNFYYTFAVTVLWTVTNVSLHVIIGLGLALILKDKFLKLKGVYRVLLIVPWAVPNYITALIWKGMFHKQFGAVNYFLSLFGVESISWFQSFITAFSANLITNTWLGFPFMMVVSLGALQSIPEELYEAAKVDGASKWAQFINITLPLLKSALFPAIILGTIWTFNMFNIIYLVSGGAPTNSTDILITESYRWAFERDQYGYAAAYSTVIFLILLIYTLITNRITHATKGVFD